MLLYLGPAVRGQLLLRQIPRACGARASPSRRARARSWATAGLAALVEDGRVYTWGGNSNGQLGHDDEQPRLLPTALGRGVFGGSKVVVVACGTAHTMAVTAEGSVWTCGRNADGQLGHGGRVYTPVFTRVASSCFDGERIVIGACGDKHSIVASEADAYGRGARVGLVAWATTARPTCLRPPSCPSPRARS